MSPERQRRVLEVLDEVIEAPHEDRPARLDALCGDDRELAAEVARLLEVEEPGGLLRGPAFDVHGDPAIGRRVGDYELVELLGRGGMGTVFLAERRSFEQRVAVKIIRRGLDLDPILVQRFENERAILARLEHPNIARLLDGGTTGDGLPYVVMEYVEGEAIDVYARRRQLGVRDRLELFLQVLDAVQYAHRNLVVHRDLKPGNILITADGDAKLLDFGIAKLLDEGLAARPLHTATGESPMTPRYASPEQIRRQPISTASDVYVLGVLLFELLTDLDAYGAEASDPARLTRAVCEREPERPSTAVRRRAAGRPEPETRRLRRRLAGDLDAIVLKAMRKEPAERYGSVGQLMEDVRRHLDGEAVRALRGSAWYRAGKLVRRHRVGLAVLALVMATLATATGVSTYYFFQAESSAQQLEQTLEFIKDELFRPASPDESGRDLTVYALLRRGAGRLSAAELEDMEPAVKAEIAGTLGELLLQWGATDEALDAMGEASRWALQAYGADHSEVVKRLNNFNVALFDLEAYDRAARYFDRLLREREQSGSDDEHFRIRSNLANALLSKGELKRAVEIQRSILEERIELYMDRHGPHDQDIATSRHNLAAALYASGDFEAALDLATQALESRQKAPKPRTSRIEKSRELVALASMALEQHSEVRSRLEKVLDFRISSGSPPLAVVEARCYLAESLLDENPGRASVLLDEALETLERRPDSWRTAMALSLRALLDARAGRLSDPGPARTSYERLAEVRGEDSTVTRRARERWLEVEERLATVDDAR